MSNARRNVPVEIELKLAVPPGDLARLRRRLSRFGKGTKSNVDNVYYDTAGRLLAQHQMALRVRRIDGRWLQTLKTEAGAGALAQRDEWEVPAPRGRLEPARFGDTPLSALLKAHPRSRLQPVFRTRFLRTLWRADSGAIEVALDQGEIVAGERVAPILELELELKSGSADALYRLALKVVGKGRAALALLPATESKAARGYRLAAGELSVPMKANARAVVGALPRQTTVAAALRSVVDRATTMLLVNAAGRGTSADPEFVHQARVAVRRVRSATRLLGKAAAWPAGLDDDLRWIGREFGAVRDWDVLQLQTLPALIADMPALAQLPALVEQAAKQRRRDDQALLEAVASARFARLALRLLQWAHSAGGPSVTLADAAGTKLARLHKRLFDSAAFFATLPTASQHRVRIRAKRLRYALDVFGGAVPAAAAARYGRQLAQLQDELGALNDAMVAIARLRKLSRPARVDARPAAERLEQQRQQHALRAEAALAELARTPVPWR